MLSRSKIRQAEGLLRDMFCEQVLLSIEELLACEPLDGFTLEEWHEMVTRYVTRVHLSVKLERNV